MYSNDNLTYKRNFIFPMKLTFFVLIFFHSECQGEKPKGYEQNDLFKSIDGDGDGVLRSDEIKSFVEEIGTPAFDDKHEIDNGVQLILSNVNSNFDKVLSESDLKTYWKHLGELLTVEETSRWVEHSVQLPHLGKLFKANAIAGDDIASLLQNNDEMKELGISPKHQRVLKRAISMKLMGLGRVPSPPEEFTFSSTCRRISLRWMKPKTDGGIPVHKYILQKSSSLSEEQMKWVVVADGLLFHYHDLDVRSGGLYDYRLEAWNILGHSEYAFLDDAKLEDCQDDNFGIFTGIMLMKNLTMYSQLILSFIFLSVFYLLHKPLIRLLHAVHKHSFLDSQRASHIIVSEGTSEYFEETLGQSQSKDQNSEITTEKQSEDEKEVVLAEYLEPVSKLSKDVSINKCRFCQRKFGPTLLRHHCSRCTGVFCTRDGYTPHFPLSDCGIPGKCICSSCILQEQRQQAALAQATAEIRHRTGRKLEEGEVGALQLSPTQQRNAVDLWRKMRLVVKVSNCFKLPASDAEPKAIVLSPKNHSPLSRRLKPANELSIFGKLKGKNK